MEISSHWKYCFQAGGFYPNRVEETRTFDAMNRLLTLRTEAIGRESFGSEYKYDAVGSALKMFQTSENLAGKAPAAAYTWGYDDRYRLTSEEIDITGGTNYLTSYTWDCADNRLSKTAYENNTLTAAITYTNNALNQMTGWHDSVANKDVAYAYDANGSRTGKTEGTAGGPPATTTYAYDFDNRLIQASAGSLSSTFAYDYRSRRYYRSTSPTNNMYCVFDGGLSIQEYIVPQASSLPSAATLSTEFIRGEGLGGGVGGMVYSIKPPAPGSEFPAILCSHSNHRGDVIARSNSNGSLTSFALYEAYGTRPYDWSDGVTGDPDRQKANTKEEESDLNLLNEGMRFRDLETGVFLTRDPTGFKDGPNVYCYVGCNPITRFDALGLKGNEVTAYNPNFGAEMLVYDTDSAFQSGTSFQLVHSGFGLGAEVVNQSVDIIAEDAAVAGQFVKGTAVGVGEVVTGQEAAAPTTQAELNGRKLGRAGTQAVGEVTEAVGAVQTVVGLVEMGGGTGGAAFTCGGTLVFTAHGAAVTAGGMLEIYVGGVLVDNAQQLGPLRLESRSNGRQGQKGGGKTGRKINSKREDNWRERLKELEDKRADAKTKAEKKELTRQIKHARTKLEKSESHANTGQGSK